ncbi:XdhC family protein [Dongshaea marina]|uniref:XdhC family protein n=1 Tax=Dongshaea marina TaxID=2047966 RepID=UPI001F330093|nr:XdhC family protein [Dongshaea marina]
MNLFEEASRLQAANRAFAMASIIETRGSAPRHNARMLVRDDGSIEGTIGGGMIERHVIEQAGLAIAAGISRMIEGNMAPQGSKPKAVGGDCGGQ